jgi:DNA-3-methyladenine glycosylase II
MAYLEYPEEALKTLCARDEKLKAVIERVGPIKRERFAEPFAALIRSLVGQQISTKAAQAINARLADASGLVPSTLAGMDEQNLRDIGLSARKAQYIKGVAQAVVDGTLVLDELHTMDDAELVRTLCALRGVGVWTAQMLMIFSLGRMDVLSERDLGVVRGIRRVYGIDELTPAFIDALKARVSPYGTVASLYFWHVAAE